MKKLFAVVPLLLIISIAYVSFLDPESPEAELDPELDTHHSESHVEESIESHVEEPIEEIRKTSERSEPVTQEPQAMQEAPVKVELAKLEENTSDSLEEVKEELVQIEELVMNEESLAAESEGLESPDDVENSFRQKWLPSSVASGQFFNRETNSRPCYEEDCTPTGSKGVLLTGIVLQLDSFEGQINAGHYFDKTPMIYLK